MVFLSDSFQANPTCMQELHEIRNLAPDQNIITILLQDCVSDWAKPEVKNICHIKVGNIDVIDVSAIASEVVEKDLIEFDTSTFNESISNTLHSTLNSTANSKEDSKTNFGIDGTRANRLKEAFDPILTALKVKF
jgi:hypothetical protein